MKSKPQVKRVHHERTRESASPLVVTGHLYGERVTNGVKTVLANTPRVLTETNPITMHDWVTPGFEQLKANGELVMLPMEKLSTEYSGSDSGFRVKLTNANGYEVWDEAANVGRFYFSRPAADPNNIDIENLKTYVQTKALASVKTSSMMGFVAAAEAKKTIAMLAYPVGSLYGLMSWINQLLQARQNIVIDRINGYTRRVNGRVFTYIPRHKRPKIGKPIGPPRILIPFGKGVSGAVLAYNLGLKPMMMDVDAIVNTIPQAHQLSHQTYREKDSREQKTSRTQTYVSGGYSFKAKVETEHVVTCRATIIAEDVFNILQDFGVSMFDVPEAMWELIPYSFVYDYWQNVGDYLGALRALATQRIAAACVVTKIDTSVTRTWLDTTVSAPWVVERKLVGQDRWHVEAKTRTVGLDHIGLATTPWSESLKPVAIQNQLSLICQTLIRLATGGKKTPFY